jgi:predicted nucleotidyltransferase
MIRRALVLVLAGAMLAVTPMAEASPPDQSWLAGLYDNADHDHAVLAVTAAVASLDYRPWPDMPAVHLSSTAAPVNDITYG